MEKDIKKILVVDDEAQIIKSITRHLSRIGFSLGSASNIEEAWKRIREAACLNEPFDLVITDVAMPGGSGVTLSQWIRERYPDISILFISGYGVGDLVLSSIRPMQDDFCQKPFSPAKLLKTIHSIEQGRHSHIGCIRASNPSLLTMKS